MASVLECRCLPTCLPNEKINEYISREIVVELIMFHLKRCLTFMTSTCTPFLSFSRRLLSTINNYTRLDLVRLMDDHCAQMAKQTSAGATASAGIAGPRAAKDAAGARGGGGSAIRMKPYVHLTLTDVLVTRALPLVTPQGECSMFTAHCTSPAASRLVL